VESVFLEKVRSNCMFIVVYYESIKRELNRKLIYECRCDERLKVKTEGSTRLVYTGLCEVVFTSVMGECVMVKIKVSLLYSKYSVVFQSWWGVTRGGSLFGVESRPVTVHRWSGSGGGQKHTPPGSVRPQFFVNDPDPGVI